MTLLTLHPRYDDESQLIWQAAVNRGWTVQRVASASDAQLGGVLYGGYEWGARIAPQLGITLQSPPEDWLVNAPFSLTQRVTVRQRVRDIQSFPVFAKSLHGKSIASRVYWSLEDFPPESAYTEVLVQAPIVWKREYRAFISRTGSVRAVCQYARWHDLYVETTDEDVSAFIRAAALPVLPAGPYVMDVGEIEGLGWAIVELNPTWCSSIYACDPDGALDVIAESCGVQLPQPTGPTQHSE